MNGINVLAEFTVFTSLQHLVQKKHDAKDSIFLRYINQATVYYDVDVWNMSIPKITDEGTLKLRCIVCLFWAQKPPSGPGPPHSRGL
jgi:hypothetical protein